MSNPQSVHKIQSNPEFIGGLDLVDVAIYPLPGATIRRPWEVDARFKLTMGTKFSDLITLYEHVATIRHKETKQMYLAVRETIDCLYFRQQDHILYPDWLMRMQEKKAELRIFFLRVKDGQLPSRYSHLGTSEEWWPKWLEDVGLDWVHDSLSDYLLGNKIIHKEMVKR